MMASAEDVDALRGEVHRLTQQVEELKETMGSVLLDIAAEHDEQMSEMRERIQNLVLIVMDLHARSLANEPQNTPDRNE